MSSTFSIAGLWTARVCADHFEDVVVVEPEAWLATDDGVTPIYDENGDEIKNAAKFPRTRVIQYHGLHCKPTICHFDVLL